MVFGFCDLPVLRVLRHSMESFPEASSRLLRELKLQLNHRPLLLSGERLLQISSVNMFSVDNAVPRGDDAPARGCSFKRICVSR